MAQIKVGKYRMTIGIDPYWNEYCQDFESDKRPIPSVQDLVILSFISQVSILGHNPSEGWKSDIYEEKDTGMVYLGINYPKIMQALPLLGVKTGAIEGRIQYMLDHEFLCSPTTPPKKKIVYVQVHPKHLLGMRNFTDILVGAFGERLKESYKITYLDHLKNCAKRLEKNL